jgi:hypothetical protein
MSPSTYRTWEGTGEWGLEVLCGFALAGIRTSNPIPTHTLPLKGRACSGRRRDVRYWQALERRAL